MKCKITWAFCAMHFLSCVPKVDSLARMSLHKNFSRMFTLSQKRAEILTSVAMNDRDDTETTECLHSQQFLNRRKAIHHTASFISAVTASIIAAPNESNADIEDVVAISMSTSPQESNLSSLNGKAVTLFKTKSGLQYIDFFEGTGASPKYGNFVAVKYKAYIKLPDIKGKASTLDEFDSDGGYLIKHGNGRTIPGLEEGLHTMKVGSKRRIIIPPKLGYVSSGLGPIPTGPYGRWKLNRLLDQMVKVKGGNVIFDVELLNVIEDEADQGYYDDESLTPEDFNTLRQNLESSQKAARGRA